MKNTSIIRRRFLALILSTLFLFNIIVMPVYAWSEWTTTPIQSSNTLEVETRTKQEISSKTVYNYYHYTYTYNGQKWTTYSKNPRSGITPKFETKQTDSPMPYYATYNGYSAYGTKAEFWFKVDISSPSAPGGSFETTISNSNSTIITEYRSRSTSHEHKGAICGIPNTTYEETASKDYHRKIVYEGDNLCSCGYVISKGITTLIPEKHNFNDAYCFDCYAINPEIKDKGLTYDELIMILDICGFFPVVGNVCDVANFGVSLITGDTSGAIFNLVSIIPFGNGAKFTIKQGDNVIGAVVKTTGKNSDNVKGLWLGVKKYDGSKRIIKNDFNEYKLLEDHFNRHGKDFMVKNKDEYLKIARNFFDKDSTKSMQSFVSSDGWYFLYDTATNEFGIINKYGGISTYMKPDKYENPIEYWYEQVEKYAPFN